MFFVTTTYGRTEAIDADSGKLLWRFTPPAYAGYAGSAQITTMTPRRRPRSHGDLRRRARRPRPQARDRRRQGALVDARSRATRPTRSSRRRSTSSRGLRARRDRRLHRRRAALPGPRRHPRSGATGAIVARLELALLRPARDDPALDLRGERLGDLGAARRRRRPGDRRPARRDRQRPVRRAARTGATASLVLSPDATRLLEALDADEPGGAERQRSRPRLDGAGAARRRLRRPGRQGRPAAAALSSRASPA